MVEKKCIRLLHLGAILVWNRIGSGILSFQLKDANEMKKILLSIITTVLTTISIYAQSAEKQEGKSATGTLSFFVRDVENEYGLPSEIHITGNNKQYVIYTASNGQAVFENVQGRYDVEFIAEGHIHLATHFYIESGNTVNVQALLDRINRTPVSGETLSGALVEGYVVDAGSGRPLNNVSVSMNGEYRAATNADGHFSVFSTEYSAVSSDEDVAVRKSLTFSASGYSTYTISNLLLTATKITVNVTLKKGQTIEQESYFQHVLDGTAKDVAQYETSLSEYSNDEQYRSTSASASSVCSVPSSIRVGTGCSCTSCSNVSVMSIQSYTEKGIDNEWIPSWQSNAIKAGTVAYRTYGAWYVNHPVKPNYDIASTTCNQVWGSNTYANCVAAAQATAGTVLTADGSTPVRSEYSAENNGSGAPASASCGNCKSGTGGSYPCFSDNLCCGKTRAGHGRGMCQWGTQRWAQSGKNFTWIISQYYAPGNITVCGSAPPSCGTATGLTAGSITSGSAILGWTAVSGAVSYNVQYKLASATSWTTVASTAATKTITGLAAATPYEFRVQAVCTISGAYSAVAAFTTVAAPSSSTVTVGNGNNPYSAHPFGTVYMDERTQYIVTKAELSAAGLTAGPTQITSLALNVTSAASQSMLGFTISIAHTTGAAFSNTSFLSGSNATTVYSGTATAVSGWNTFNFTTPFAYNGSSNLLITICWNNSSFTANSSVQCSNYTDYKALYYRADLASSGVCGKTTGTRSYYRPNFKFTFNTPSSMPTVPESDVRNFVEEEEALPGVNETFLEMYPNPFDGRAISGKFVNADGSAALSESGLSTTWNIYDLPGREMNAGTIAVEGGEFTLNFDGGLKPGLYMIYIDTPDNKKYQKKLLVR
jgi:peptidoglycan hydrolase-like amidase